MNRRVATLLVAAVASLGYLAWLVGHTSAVAGGSDSSGYLNEARMIARGQLRLPMEPMRRLQVDDSFAPVFAPLGFAPGTVRWTMVPTYPPGLPLHFAVAGMMAGWERAPFLVQPLAALTALWLLYFIGRELGLSRWWSTAPPLLLTVSATFLHYAVQAVSDDLACAWTLAAILCALLARRKDHYAWAAGVAFAIGVAVRPSNLLLALPLAFALEWRLRRLVVAALASLPIGAGLLWWNHALYGNAFTTGYGSAGALFDLSYPLARFPHYSMWLWKTLTPLVYPGGLFLLFDRRLRRMDRALLLAWFAPFFAFYCFYGAYDAWWYTRFLLPAIPALILGSALLLRDAAEAWVRPGRLRTALAVVVIAAIALRGAKQTRRLHIFSIQSEESVYPETVHWAESLLPRNALVVTMQASGAFIYYSGRQTGRWDFLDSENFGELRGRAISHHLQWYAVTFDFETKEWQSRLPGHWTPLARRREATIWRNDS
ncbi:MAG: hypothetical protein JWN02_2412 [Acidobacteria bacterium]|nr:hypothetical protein [Acidobacteriota bacterium]